MNIDQLKSPEIEALPILPRLKSLRLPNAVDILHLEKIHPTLSGNKWFKLKYNLIEAQKQGFSSLLSCGGPHSNHLHALANAGETLGFKTTAFIRGYEHLPLTPTLLDCQKMNMSLVFLDKHTYKLRYDSQWCLDQAKKYNSFWIPEGGDNELGHRGCEALAEYCHGYDEVWLSIGSGCTFLGLADGLKALGFSSVHMGSKNLPILRGFLAIKGGASLAETLLKKVGQGHLIETKSHLGGFGKCPEPLIQLIQDYDEQGLYLDPVYTAKLIMAFEQKWQSNILDESKRYLLIHTGGLQGRRGISSLSASAP